ncbi:hypothetical protein BDR22DRAFT_232488 [Usnea florida]
MGLHWLWSDTSDTFILAVELSSIRERSTYLDSFAYRHQASVTLGSNRQKANRKAPSQCASQSLHSARSVGKGRTQSPPRSKKLNLLAFSSCIRTLNPFLHVQCTTSSSRRRTRQYHFTISIALIKPLSLLINEVLRRKGAPVSLVDSYTYSLA